MNLRLERGRMVQTGRSGLLYAVQKRFWIRLGICCVGRITRVAYNGTETVEVAFQMETNVGHGSISCPI